MRSSKKIHPKRNHNEKVYHITFGNYLNFQMASKPEVPQTQADQSRPELHLKLLEHPVLLAAGQSKGQRLKRTFRKYIDGLKLPKTKGSRGPTRFGASLREAKVAKYFEKWKRKRPPKVGKLPKFLAFLKARHDEGLCKRKTGFEIYCEMASIHGFANFVGARTWQRIFWFIVILVAMLMTGFVLVLQYLQQTNTPTVLYIENTQYPTRDIPFPAVTICDLNMMSRRKALTKANEFQLQSNRSAERILSHFPLLFYGWTALKASQADYQQFAVLLKDHNYTSGQLQRELQPDCGTQLLRCKWQGRQRDCAQLFRRVATVYGTCCAFNSQALPEMADHLRNNPGNTDIAHAAGCGYQSGLTVLLQPALEDYMASLLKVAGYQVLVHSSYDFAEFTVSREFIQPQRETRIVIVPRQIHATEYVRSVPPLARRCLLKDERTLFSSRRYTQSNCLLECRSALLQEKCGCVLPHWPRKDHWSICDLPQHECVTRNREILSKTFKDRDPDQLRNPVAEQFICDCLPTCDCNRYDTLVDTAKLDRRFSLGDADFFKDIKLENHTLVHVYYGELVAERLRLDVYQNWLTYVGTFGGITALYMGYSVISGFEIVFFVLVRPACNWLNRKQIRHRVRQRQKRAANQATGQPTNEQT